MAKSHSLVTPSVSLMNGPFYIPGIERTPKGSPCRLQIWLDAVSYGGEDIGSRWYFTAQVRGSFWRTPGVVTLRWRQSLPVNKMIHDEVLENGCDLTFPIDFFCRAREYDPFFDDVGDRLDVTAIKCTREGEGMRYVLIVPVQEHSIWRWVLRKPSPSALIFYFFRIEAKCQ